MLLLSHLRGVRLHVYLSRPNITKLRNYTILQALVVIITCTYAAAGMLWLNFNPDITYIDKVAKALDLDIAIVMAHYGSKKIILVRDDHQLQPMIISNVKTNCFSNHLRYPLFKRLKNLGYPSIMFRKQHQLVKSLASLPSQLFHAGKLIDALLTRLTEQPVAQKFETFLTKHYPAKGNRIKRYLNV